MRKISSPPGFDPRTVLPVDIRYTYYATRPTNYVIYLLNLRSVVHRDLRHFDRIPPITVSSSLSDAHVVWIACSQGKSRMQIVVEVMCSLR